MLGVKKAGKTLNGKTLKCFIKHFSLRDGPGRIDQALKYYNPVKENICIW